MSWPLLVYDFPPSFADLLTPVVNRYLKKWLKVHHPASPEFFYLPEAGLGLNHPKTFLKCMQLTKHHLLANSNDPTVRFIYEAKLRKASRSRANKWSPETTLQEIKKIIDGVVQVYRPDNIIGNDEGSGNCYAKAFHTEGPDLADQY